MNRTDLTDNVAREVQRQFELVRRQSQTRHSGVELFCGRGELITGKIASLVQPHIGLDIDPVCQNSFLSHAPSSNFVCGDGIALALTGALGHAQFSLVTMDNPLGIFGPYCEHFEALGVLCSLQRRGTTLRQW